MLAGAVIFDCSDFRAAWKTFSIRYAEISKDFPAELLVEQFVTNTPFGKALGVFFVWSSEDNEAGRAWLAKVETLGNVVMNQVGVTTVPEVCIPRESSSPSHTDYLSISGTKRRERWLHLKFMVTLRRSIFEN